MKENLYYLILIIVFNFSLSFPSCKEGENFCLQCHNKLDLCTQCVKEILEPDDFGGCKSIKICQNQTNHCLECNLEIYAKNVKNLITQMRKVAAPKHKIVKYHTMVIVLNAKIIIF